METIDYDELAVYRIGEIVRRTGRTHHTIYSYERAGLIEKPFMDFNGQRRYSENQAQAIQAMFLKKEKGKI